MEEAAGAGAGLLSAAAEDLAGRAGEVRRARAVDWPGAFLAGLFLAGDFFAGAAFLAG